MASFHFDSGQFPPSFSAELQNQGVKLQEITAMQRSGCSGHEDGRPSTPPSLSPPLPTLRGLWKTPAVGAFLPRKLCCEHGYLLEAAPMPHADERHAQLLADAVELALHLFSQGTGGFIKHWGQNRWEGMESCPPASTSPELSPHLLLAGSRGQAASALAPGNPALERPRAEGAEAMLHLGSVWPAAGQNQFTTSQVSTRHCLAPLDPGNAGSPRMSVLGRVHTCHPPARRSWGDGRPRVTEHIITSLSRQRQWLRWQKACSDTPRTTLRMPRTATWAEPCHPPLQRQGGWAGHRRLPYTSNTAPGAGEHTPLHLWALTAPGEH